MNISIVNYQGGNTGSILNMINAIDKSFKVNLDNNKLKFADKIILPGVGHFGKCMKNLIETGIIEELTDLVTIKKKWILGICVGFQILFDKSEECDVNGLSFLTGELKKFPDNKKYYPPNIGWRRTNFINSDSKFFYYLHSYYLNKEIDIKESSSFYGCEFTSSIKSENIVGCQFHPERSLKFGQEYLEKFLRR